MNIAVCVREDEQLVDVLPGLADTRGDLLRLPSVGDQALIREGCFERRQRLALTARDGSRDAIGIVARVRLNVDHFDFSTVGDREAVRGVSALAVGDDAEAIHDAHEQRRDKRAGLDRFLHTLNLRLRLGLVQVARIEAGLHLQQPIGHAEDVFLLDVAALVKLFERCCSHVVILAVCGLVDGQRFRCWRAFAPMVDAHFAISSASMP